MFFAADVAETVGNSSPFVHTDYRDEHAVPHARGTTAEQRALRRACLLSLAKLLRKVNLPGADVFFHGVTRPTAIA